MFVFPAPYVAAAGGVTSLAFEDHTTSTDSATITGSANIQAGDLLVLGDRGSQGGASAPPEAVPSGFTIAQSAVVSVIRHVLSYKIADGTEASASLTGMNHDLGSKILAVFRPNSAITTASDASGGAEGTSGNPSAQSVVASGGTPPLLVLGAYGAFSATVDPRSFSPAQDASLNETGSTDDQWLLYKIYNSSPQDTSIDMDDEGSINTLLSCYIQVS